MIKANFAQQILNYVAPGFANQANQMAQMAQPFADDGMAAGGDNSFSGGSLFDIELGESSPRHAKNTRKPELEADEPSRMRDYRPGDRKKLPKAELTEVNEAQEPQNEAPRRMEAGRSHAGDEKVESSSDTSLDAQTSEEEESHPGEQPAQILDLLAMINPLAAPLANGEAAAGSSVEAIISRAQAMLAELKSYQLANPKLPEALQKTLATLGDGLRNMVETLSYVQPGSSVQPGQLPPIAGLSPEQARAMQNLLVEMAAGNKGALATLQELPEAAATHGAEIQQKAQVQSPAMQRILSALGMGGVASQAVNAVEPKQISPVKPDNVASAEPLTTSNAPSTEALSATAGKQHSGDLNTSKEQHLADDLAQHSRQQRQEQAVIAAQSSQTAPTGFAAATQSQPSTLIGQAAGLEGKASASTPASEAVSGQTSPSSGSSNSSASTPASTTASLTKDSAEFEHALKHSSRPQLSEQVQFQLKSMIRNGQNHMIVKLDPPELGEMEISMRVQKSGKTDVHIQVERPQTLELLQRDSRLLMQALQDAGLKTDSGSLSFNFQGDNQSSSGGQRPRPVYPVKEESFDGEVLSILSENYTLEIRNGVNIHI